MVSLYLKKNSGPENSGPLFFLVEEFPYGFGARTNAQTAEASY